MAWPGDVRSLKVDEDKEQRWGRTMWGKKSVLATGRHFAKPLRWEAELNPAGRPAWQVGGWEHTKKSKKTETFPIEMHYE